MLVNSCSGLPSSITVTDTGYIAPGSPGCSRLPEYPAITTVCRSLNSRLGRKAAVSGFTCDPSLRVIRKSVGLTVVGSTGLLKTTGIVSASSRSTP